MKQKCEHDYTDEGWCKHETRCCICGELKPQQTPDEKVLDYLERAENIEMKMFDSKDNETFNRIIEIAKLLQREEKL